jgi:hypothetical protein
MARIKRSDEVDWMVKKGLLLVFALLAFVFHSFAEVGTKQEFFKVEDLRPGMKGIGKTCYQGTKPEEFQVEILGILHGVNPGANAVLAKFSGGLLDKVGIFEGMSGSPVFIDGKLLGAVAFSYSFAKEAIGGITPITQMVDGFEEPEAFPSGIIYKKSRLWSYRLPLPSHGIKSSEMPVFLNSIRQQQVWTAAGGHNLIPIGTPLSLGGFHNQTLKLFASQFRELGMSIQQGTGGTDPGTAVEEKSKSSSIPSFEPGSNIVVSLVQGDLDVSAGGTVTYVDGDRLYAFGHNLLELGYTELPMHAASAITVFPSLESSFKILEAGPLVGTIRQDRGMGIYGIIGERPHMVPMRIQLTTSRGVKKIFNYELVHDALLTPLLVNLAIYNTIIASERAQGTVTLDIKGKIDIKDEDAVKVNNRFCSDEDAAKTASLSIAVPVNYLMAAGYKNLNLEKIDLEISAFEKDQAAALESIRLNRTEVKAGETVDLEVSYRRINGELLQDTYPVKIPENASPGLLNLLVADGSAIMSLDEQDEGESLIPRDLSQLIKFVNNMRKNDHLYLRFFRREPGVVVNGEGMPGLPPSILSIVKSERKVGAVSMVHTSSLMEYELPAVDYMIAGSKMLNLTVKQ